MKNASDICREEDDEDEKENGEYDSNENRDHDMEDRLID